MLIGHLKDVVAFLGRGMNGSFDVSDVSLNIPQASIIDTVEVSFISKFLRTVQMNVPAISHFLVVRFAHMQLVITQFHLNC